MSIESQSSADRRSASPLLPATLLLAFALSVGYYAYRAYFPGARAKYLVGGDLELLSYPEEVPESPHLYLRRTFYLTQRPTHAWVELVGHDELSLFVNGQRLTGRARSGTGRETGVLQDVTPFLQVGRNCIAVYAKQLTLHRAPQVAIRGGYTLEDGHEYFMDRPEQWRVTNVYDRRGMYWYDVDFNDDHWQSPGVASAQTMWAGIDIPPSTIKTPFDSADWIVAAASTSGRTMVARRFQLKSPPQEGWLRLICSSAHRVAINGIVIDDDFERLATLPPYQPQQISYDVSSLLRPGQNDISIMLSTSATAPRIRAHLDIISLDGQRTHIDSDSTWSTTSLATADWLRPSFRERDGWLRCLADTSFAEIPAWRPLREVREIRRSWRLVYRRLVQLSCSVLGVGFLGWLGTVLVSRLATRLARLAAARVSPQLAWLALVPSTLAATAAGLIELDSSFAHWPLFQLRLLALLAVAVAAQWFLILFLSIT